MLIEELRVEIGKLDVPYIKVPGWVVKAKYLHNEERMTKALEFLKEAHERYQKKVKIGAPNPRDYDRTGKGDYLKVTCSIKESYYE